MDGEIVPRHEQVNGVRRPGTQRVREFTANPEGSRRGREGVGVTNLCEADVPFDVFGELNGIACTPIDNSNANDPYRRFAK